MLPRDFKVRQIVHHRNGIAGRTFHSVFFTWDNLEMIAVLPVGGNHSGPDVDCFVVCPAQPNECYRGDCFVDQVRQAVLDHEKASEADFRKRLAALPKATHRR